MFGSGAGSKPGLEIWRIENKKPAPWPAEKFGKFYSGDSYLILNTTVSKSGKFEWDLFFWLGKNSSVDEMGIAAYKTVCCPKSFCVTYALCVLGPWQFISSCCVSNAMQTNCSIQIETAG
jgi:hypothetical protein